MGKGGGKGSGGGAAGALGAAERTISAVGLTHTENWYSRGDLPRIAHASSAYSGVTTTKAANAIATGRKGSMSNGKKLPPIHVYVDAKSRSVSIPDGRHRLRVAQEAGATKIRALVRTEYRGRMVQRVAIVPIQGKSTR